MGRDEKYVDTSTKDLLIALLDRKHPGECEASIETQIKHERMLTQIDGKLDNAIGWGKENSDAIKENQKAIKANSDKLLVLDTQKNTVLGIAGVLSTAIGLLAGFFGGKFGGGN